MATSDLIGSSSQLLRVLAGGVGGYLALVVLLRLSGKRTLSKLNAFDFVVTVALGSTLASVMTSSTLPLLDGLAALALLVILQFAITWTAVRLPGFNRAIKSEASLVLRDGALLPVAMRRERVTQDEVLAAVRNAGGAALEQALYVFLEADGSLVAILRNAGSVER